jgi:hypothetical protein
VQTPERPRQVGAHEHWGGGMGAIAVLLPLLLLVMLSLMAFSLHKKRSRARAPEPRTAARKGAHRRSRSEAMRAQIPKPAQPGPPRGRSALQQPGRSEFGTAGRPLPAPQSRSPLSRVTEGLNTPSRMSARPRASAWSSEPVVSSPSVWPGSSPMQPVVSFGLPSAIARAPVASPAAGAESVNLSGAPLAGFY